MPTLLPATEGVASRLLHERPFIARYLVRRKAGMSWDEFRHHQIEVHSPLSVQIPGVLDYQMHLFPPEGDEVQPFDGMAEVTFATAEDHDRGLASEQGQAAVADLPNYTDVSAMVVLRGDVSMSWVGKLTG